MKILTTLLKRKTEEHIASEDKYSKLLVGDVEIIGDRTHEEISPFEESIYDYYAAPLFLNEEGTATCYEMANIAPIKDDLMSKWK